MVEVGVFLVLGILVNLGYRFLKLSRIDVEVSRNFFQRVCFN